MEITSQLVRELLHYEPATGVFTWRERGKHWFKSDRLWKSWNSTRAGKRAGCLKTNTCGYQYRQIGLFRKFYSEHRLAWLYMSDEPLPEALDHINRIAVDNRWANLRASSDSDNMHNRSMPCTNTSGVVGVGWSKRAGKWATYCKLSDKTHYLGSFDDKAEAERTVRAFRKKHGFDEGHGSRAGA